MYHGNICQSCNLQVVYAREEREAVDSAASEKGEGNGKIARQGLGARKTENFGTCRGFLPEWETLTRAGRRVHPGLRVDFVTDAVSAHRNSQRRRPVDSLCRVAEGRVYKKCWLDGTIDGEQGDAR